MSPSSSPSVLERRLRVRSSIARARALTEGPPRSVPVCRPPSVAMDLLAWSTSATHARGAREAERAAANAQLERALREPVTAATAGALGGIDPALLGPRQLLARLRLADRVASWAAAQASAALADYVGAAPEPTRPGVLASERHLRLEVRVARRCSDDAAARDIAAARDLAGACRPVRDLWARGEIGGRHVTAVLDRTAHASDELTAAVLGRVAPRLPSMPAPRVRAAITRAMCALDPRGEAQRTREARRHDVGVHYRSLPDGLAQVVATHTVEDARAVMEAIDSAADRVLAHRRGCEPCAGAVPDEIGPARAVAHRSLVLEHNDAGAAEPTSAGRAGRRRGELQVVVDLATLLGLAENPGTVAGEPVPAPVARELAAACGSLRRIVTDPVTGHLLDYGTRTYLPQALKVFVAARDGTCRGPGCGQPAARSQLDHVEPFPTGPSDVANTQMRCKRDHDSKTEGDITVHDPRADGSCSWTTRHGQSGSTPPRPYLNDPTDIPPF